MLAALTVCVINSYFQGEICVASSRVFVQEGIYDELVKKLEEKAKAWVVGDPFDPNVRQGPQVTKQLTVKIQDHALISKCLVTNLLKIAG